MSKWISSLGSFVILTIISTSTYAFGESDSGYYLGFMAGPTTSGTSNTTSSKTSSFGLGFALGYEANPFFSYEVGLQGYPQAQGSESEESESTNSGCSSANQRKLYLNVALKGTLPLARGIGIFSKAGIATPIFLPFLNSCKENNNMAQFYPTVSLGSSFELSNGLVADLSWSRIVTRGATKNIDLYALGISYHFHIV